MPHHTRSPAGELDGVSIARALATAAAVILALSCEGWSGPKSPNRTTAWPTTATTIAANTSLRRSFARACICLLGGTVRLKTEMENEGEPGH